MIRHYLTFAHQAALLDETLRGQRLAECWSGEKNALALRFIDREDSLFVDISLDLHAGYLLLSDDLSRSRRNTIDFFNDLLGVRLLGVSIDEGERIVRFSFATGETLAVILFGSGGGNALHLRDNGVVGWYRRYEGTYDDLLSPDTSRSPEGKREDLAASIHRASTSVERAVASALPELGRRLAVEAALRAGIAPTTPASDLDTATINAILAQADQLYNEAQISEEFHLYELDREAIFSLVPLHEVAERSLSHTAHDEIGAAVRSWRRAHFRRKRFGELREQLLRRADHDIMRLGKALSHRLDAPTHRRRADEWEHLANILMVNLHVIERGAAHVALHDWEKGETIAIELSATLTPVENAERYYRRARGARAQAERAERGVVKTRSDLERMQGLRQKIVDAESLDVLERIAHENPRLTMKEGEQKAPGSADRFRRFEVAGGLEVFAGKSAANNDELTVRFAKPNDYWFHARGASGSHVVLRWGDAKAKPPKEAIREAASIAAYYSGARNAKSVPVAYTMKKYVRKPRGAAPGAVIMEREQVVMAEPRLPAMGEDGE